MYVQVYLYSLLGTFAIVLCGVLTKDDDDRLFDVRLPGLYLWGAFLLAIAVAQVFLEDPHPGRPTLWLLLGWLLAVGLSINKGPVRIGSVIALGLLSVWVPGNYALNGGKEHATLIGIVGWAAGLAFAGNPRLLGGYFLSIYFLNRVMDTHQRLMYFDGPSPFKEVAWYLLLVAGATGPSMVALAVGRSLVRHNKALQPTRLNEL